MHCITEVETLQNLLCQCNDQILSLRLPLNDFEGLTQKNNEGSINPFLVLLFVFVLTEC